MARYIVGAEKHFRDNRLYQPGEELVRPDDEKPSRTFIPVDAAARKAMAKHHPDVQLPPLPKGSKPEPTEPPAA